MAGARAKSEASIPSIPALDAATLDEMRRIYRQIRIAVHEEGTKPPLDDPATHHANKLQLKTRITDLCDKAGLAIYSQPNEESRRLLWHHLWSKIIYAGFPGDTSTKGVKGMQDIFDQYEELTTDDWRMSTHRAIKRDKKTGEEVSTKYGKYTHIQRLDPYSSGPKARDFFLRRNQYEGKDINRNQTKIKKILEVAKEYKAFFEQHPNASGIDFIIGLGTGLRESDVWAIHRRLQRQTAYKGGVTGLHFMMDVGYDVIKPDRVIARAFFQLGWLHKIVDLPPDIKEIDIVPPVKGKKSDYDDSEEDDDTTNNSPEKGTPTRAVQRSQLTHHFRRGSRPCRAAAYPGLFNALN